jgi:capsular exopolysaccharide synthesis family protein
MKKKSISLFDYIYTTSTTGLFVLPSGPIPFNPVELLSSYRFLEIIEEMEAFFDLIIFDSPPVLLFADAQIVSSIADGTIFVVPKAQVKKNEVQESKKLLDQVKTNIVDIIYNRDDNKRTDYYS